MTIGAETKERWRELRREGWTVSDIARESGASRTTVTAAVGTSDDPGEGMRERFGLWAVRAWYDAAADVAASFGLRNRTGEDAGKGSPAKLLEAIGRGDIVCTRVR